PHSVGAAAPASAAAPVGRPGDADDPDAELAPRRGGLMFGVAAVVAGSVIAVGVVALFAVLIAVASYFAM
ncbi:MAG: hypothetical protein ABMB14_00485, partial [Myxococcota bacterium]